MAEVKSLYDIGFEHGYAKAKEDIVRCKDCRYNYANMIPNGKGCQQNVYVETADNWYCADGEREDEVEE